MFFRIVDRIKSIVKKIFELILAVIAITFELGFYGIIGLLIIGFLLVTIISLYWAEIIKYSVIIVLIIMGISLIVSTYSKRKRQYVSQGVNQIINQH